MISCYVTWTQNFCKGLKCICEVTSICWWCGYFELEFKQNQAGFSERSDQNWNSIFFHHIWLDSLAWRDIHCIRTCRPPEICCFGLSVKWQCIQNVYFGGNLSDCSSGPNVVTEWKILFVKKNVLFFSGLTLESGKHYSQSVEHSFHVSMAALELDDDYKSMSSWGFVQYGPMQTVWWTLLT